MTTANTTATTTAILALDLGKYKSVACAYDPSDGGAARFHTLPTSRAELSRLLAPRRRCHRGLDATEKQNAAPVWSSGLFAGARHVQ
jgi:hypothetical protein